MQVKTLVQMLDIPKGTVGEIVKFRSMFRDDCSSDVASACEIQFPGKEETILLQYPGGSLYDEV